MTLQLQQEEIIEITKLKKKRIQFYIITYDIIFLADTKENSLKIQNYRIKFRRFNIIPKIKISLFTTNNDIQFLKKKIPKKSNISFSYVT